MIFQYLHHDRSIAQCTCMYCKLIYTFIQTLMKYLISVKIGTKFTEP